ncbi:hypothetical protein BGX27_003732, partial [Mortierella sp. AM989]
MEMHRFLKGGSFAALCSVKDRLEKIDDAFREALWENEEREHQNTMKKASRPKHVIADIPTIWTPTKKRKDAEVPCPKDVFKKNPHLTIIGD